MANLPAALEFPDTTHPDVAGLVEAARVAVVEVHVPAAVDAALRGTPVFDGVERIRSTQCSLVVID